MCGLVLGDPCQKGEHSIRLTLSSIRPTDPFHNRPTLIKRLDHLLRQWTLIQILQVLLQLCHTARHGNDRVATLPLQHAMVTRPPQHRLGRRHPQPPRRRPDRVKVRFVPVALAEIRALHLVWIEAAAGLVLPLVALVPVRQHSAGDGADLVKGDPVVPQAGKQFWLHGALDRVVDPLVDVRFLPSVTGAQLADLRDLPRRVVAEPETLEGARVVQLVDCL